MTELDWDLLTRYHADTCTPSERQWVERLLVAHPPVADVLAAIRELAADGDATVSRGELYARLAAVKRPTPVHDAAAPRDAASFDDTPWSDDAPSGPTARRPQRFAFRSGRGLGVRWAAGIALAVAGGAGAWLAVEHPGRLVTPPGSPAYRVMSTAPGQRLSLHLPDGTTVVLAPGSTLGTPATFGKDGRGVELEGEASFTVAHDARHPFAVRTARVVATDRGTRFLVRAYGDEATTDVVVAEGEVAVHPAGASETAGRVDSVILRRAERVRMSADGRLDHTRGVALDDYFGWTEGRLVFRDVPLRDVVRQLGRWYDIDVRLEPEATGRRLLRATVTDESATDALEMIAASLGLRLSRAGNVFTLSASH